MYNSQYNYDMNNYQRPVMNQYAYVNGVDGAKNFPISPNQTLMLMDNDSPMVFMKNSNQLGQSNLRYFKLVEINEQEARGQFKNNENYVLKSDFDELKAKIDKLLKKESKQKESDE